MSQRVTGMACASPGRAGPAFSSGSPRGPEHCVSGCWQQAVIAGPLSTGTEPWWGGGESAGSPERGEGGLPAGGSSALDPVQLGGGERLQDRRSAPAPNA